MRNKLTVEDFKHFQNKVIEFNLFAGNTVDNKDLIPTYISLCKEELREGIEGEYDNDPEKILDAIVDSIFVGFYLNSLYQGGFSDEWFECVIKHPEQDPVTFSTLQKDLDINYINRYARDLTELVKRYDALFDIRGAFDRVFKSNMSKFASKKVVDIQTEITYIESQGRYAQVSADTVEVGGREYVVFKAKEDLREKVVFDTSKIVKPSSFKDVIDLGGLGEFVY